MFWFLTLYLNFALIRRIIFSVFYLRGFENCTLCSACHDGRDSAWLFLDVEGEALTNRVGKQANAVKARA